MLNKFNLSVLDKAMESFNGVFLYYEDFDRVPNFVLRYDFYCTERGIEVWTSLKENAAGAVWLEDKYEDFIEWEEVPENYRKILGCKYVIL